MLSINLHSDVWFQAIWVPWFSNYSHHVPTIYTQKSIGQQEDGAEGKKEHGSAVQSSKYQALAADFSLLCCYWRVNVTMEVDSILISANCQINLQYVAIKWQDMRKYFKFSYFWLILNWTGNSILTANRQNLHHSTKF